MHDPPKNDIDLIYQAVLRNTKELEELRRLIEILLITDGEGRTND